LKVLVATKTQGQNPGDFCNVPEGELVCLGVDYPGKTGLTGVVSGQGTTTFVIAESSLTASDLRQQIRALYQAEGWDKLVTPRAFTQAITSEIVFLAQVTLTFPVGTVLEKRGNEVIAWKQKLENF